MASLYEFLRFATLSTFLLLAGISAVQARRRPHGPWAWAAATFGALGTVAVVGVFLAEREDDGPIILTRFLVAVLVVFPYFLLRFAASFSRPVGWIEALAGGLTLALIGWTFVIGGFPQPGEPVPAGWTGYRIAFLLQWSTLLAMVTVRLWRGGRDQPGVARKRMRTLAVAAFAMNAALVLSVAMSPRPGTGESVIVQVASLVSAFAFLLGLAPPRLLRMAWRARDEEAARAAFIDLMMQTGSVDELSRRLLPIAAAIVGARGAVLRSEGGAVMAADGLSMDEARHLEDGPDVLRVDMRSGIMLVRVSTYTPFFGRDEIGILAAFGATVDMLMERTEAAARQREFIASAAHELRTPITVIVGLAGTLLRHWPNLQEDDIRSSLEALDRQGGRAHAMVEDLLDLARLERNGTVPPEPVNLKGLARRIMEEMPPPDGKSVTLDLGDEVVARAAPIALERCMVNLLANAYAHGGSRIVVSAEGSGDDVHLVVSDDGPGVPEDLVAALFDPFAHGRDSRGTGLGLAIARRSVESFGGSVSYERNGHPGTIFRVSLPAVA